MSSKILVDELAGKTATGNITVTGEGGAATQSLQQGLCKSWCDWDNTGTPSVDDSFNVSSLTDTATGKTGLNLTNSMSSANYAQSGAGANGYSLMNDVTNPRTASRYTVIVWYASYFDAATVTALVHGDLA